jgi:hypothetical protein
MNLPGKNALINVCGANKKGGSMFWNVAAWLERFGIEAGFVIIILPIAYDLIGIIYGRDPQFKVGLVGVLMQIFGAIMMALGKYAKEWGR